MLRFEGADQLSVAPLNEGTEEEIAWPEEVDPLTSAPLGNYPQAFSHLGLIQAAARLDLALRLRDEGIDEPPILDLDHPHPH